MFKTGPEFLKFIPYRFFLNNIPLINIPKKASDFLLLKLTVTNLFENQVE